MLNYENFLTQKRDLQAKKNALTKQIKEIDQQIMQAKANNIKADLQEKK